MTMQAKVTRLGNVEAQRQVFNEPDFDDLEFSEEQLREIAEFARSTGSSPISTPTSLTSRGRAGSTTSSMSGHHGSTAGGMVKGQDPNHGRYFVPLRYGQPVTEDSDDLDWDNDSDFVGSKKVVKSPQLPRPTHHGTASAANSQRGTPTTSTPPTPSKVAPKLGFISLDDFQNMKPGMTPSFSKPQAHQFMKAPAQASRHVQHEEDWDDLELPSNLKLAPARPHHVDTHMTDWDARLQEDDEDPEEGLVFSSKNNLSLSQKRSISKTNFSGDWGDKKPGKTGSLRMAHSKLTPPVSSNSSAKSESDTENYDDLQFTDSTLTLKTPEDDFSGLEIPDDSFLDESRLPARRFSRSQSISRNPSMSVSRSSSVRTPVDPSLRVLTDRSHVEQLDDKNLGFELPKRFGSIKKVQSDGTELDSLDQPPNAQPASAQPPNAQAARAPPRRTMSTSRSLRPQGSLFGKRTMVSTEIMGDGTELDGLKDLPVTPDLDRSSSTSSISSAKSPGRKKPKLVLIKNINKTLLPNMVNNMRYDPIKQVWIGNDAELKKFEASYTPPRPGLITRIGAKGLNRVGPMVLDKKGLRWINDQGSEEPNVFDGIDDLEDHSTHTPNAPFVATEEFIQQIRETAEYHKAFASHWMDTNGQSLIGDDDREHLYLIRAIAVNRN